MTLRKLPEIRAFDRPEGLEIQPHPDVHSKWNMGVRAATDSADNSISIYDVIGEDPWSGGGITAKRIDGALRMIGKKDVVVNINSPGGDLFEGLAIYNLLRAHEAKVTVRVMAMAASAASVIAMAGDEIQIARAGFFMIHNAWVLAMGNQHDLREVADWLQPFDQTMADLYAARTGLSAKEVTKLMDSETWIGGAKAVELGFSDDFVPADQISEDPAAKAAAKDMQAVRRVDSLLARQGIPRSERRSLIGSLKTGTQDAAGGAMPNAGALQAADIQRVIATLVS